MESNKLHLYIGRVPRDEYLALKAEGWTSTPKQSEAGQGEFAATWTSSREDTALSYAGCITDEDAGPVERAADRAERFGGYLDKRLGEASGHADRYDARDSAHGFQSYAAGVRSADRHDRIATRAVNAWDKAEYWQHRTAGVISSALYKSGPGVRMGRIKVLEAELRKSEKNASDYAERYEGWRQVLKMEDDRATRTAYAFASAMSWGEYIHPRTGKEQSLYDMMRAETYDGPNLDRITGHEAAALWLADMDDPNGDEYAAAPWQRSLSHLRNRLAYENQMLEDQGGRAALVEMEVGGWIGSKQIEKVNRSAATGRVVSVGLKFRTNGTNRWGNPDPTAPEFRTEIINIERKSPGIYRAPTDEEREAFATARKAEKKAAKATAPPTIPLINPTMEEAQRLQALINAKHAASWERHHGKPTEHYGPKAGTVEECTQAAYSANSGGIYSKAETIGLAAGGEERDNSNMWTSHGDARNKRIGPVVCKVRMAGYDPRRVLVITDKPQKAFPPALWVPFAAPAEVVNA